MPGFYVKAASGRSWWTLAGGPGLLIPVRTIEGGIAALRLRPDDPRSGKYVWLSSAGRCCGASCPACCHVARPAAPPTDTRIYLTEGELKADIASEWLGAVVVSAPGVGSWRLGIAAVSALASQGAEVVVAFDADARTNRHVAARERELVAALHDEGYSVHRAAWPSDLKGIDDALVAGADVKVRPVGVTVRVVRHRRRRPGPKRTVTVGEQ